MTDHEKWIMLFGRAEGGGGFRDFRTRADDPPLRRWIAYVKEMRELQKKSHLIFTIGPTNTVSKVQVKPSWTVADERVVQIGAK